MSYLTLEKLCSVCLEHVNVYGCLVCGKYFQGRGINTWAYFHSIENDHHPFINLSSGKIYILPDNYQVLDASLNDIKYVLDPTFTKDQVDLLTSTHCTDLSGKLFTRGYVGLNNLKANDYVNVVVQALNQVIPLRNFFLIRQEGECKELLKRFGNLQRKMWNDRAFKGHVSPHEFVQVRIF